MKIFNIFFLFFLITSLGCSKSKNVIPGNHGAISALENKNFFEQVGEVKPYYSNASYADKMSTCIYADTDEKSCKISDLPLIGINNDSILVEDILKRTLVSHQFLGDIFKQVLLKMKPDMLQMFGAVSAVVISDKINPSFYYNVSGAIYLSGRFFWRDYEEWELLTKVTDFRKNAGLPFQFQFQSDYRANGKSLYERVDRDTQSIDEISNKLFRLLFHELAHANDFFPNSFYSKTNFEKNITYAEVSNERYEKLELISQQMPTKTESKKLDRIGQILFQEEPSTPIDSLISAEEVIEEFKNDVASDFYAYSTPFEDLAMLTEESLMFYYYNMYRYVVIIKLPKAYFEAPKDYEYNIAWGTKGRILGPNIKGRAVYAIESILGKNTSEKVSDKLDQSSSTDSMPNPTLNDIFEL